MFALNRKFESLQIVKELQQSKGRFFHDGKLHTLKAEKNTFLSAAESDGKIKAINHKRYIMAKNPQEVPFDNIKKQHPNFKKQITITNQNARRNSDAFGGISSNEFQEKLNLSRQNSKSRTRLKSIDSNEVLTKTT